MEIDLCISPFDILAQETSTLILFLLFAYRLFEIVMAFCQIARQNSKIILVVWSQFQGFQGLLKFQSSKHHLFIPIVFCLLKVRKVQKLRPDNPKVVDVFPCNLTKCHFSLNQTISKKQKILKDNGFLRKYNKWTNVWTNFLDFHQNWSKTEHCRPQLKKSSY